VQMQLGLRAGIGLVTLVGEDADRFSEPTFQARPTIGITAGIASARDILRWRGGLHIDVSHTSKGSGIALNGEEVASLELEYYDLSLQAVFERAIGREFHGYFLVGPRLGILRSAINVN